MQPHSRVQSLAPRSTVLSLFLVIPRLRATASALDGFAWLSPAQDLRVQPGTRTQGPAHPTSCSHCLNFGSRPDTLMSPCPCCCRQWLSRVRLFVTPWTAARQASLSITISQISLRLMSIESVMPSKHLIICCPLSSSVVPSHPAFNLSQHQRLF